MSDYITNLVFKATNPAKAALQPRLGSLFEPVKAYQSLQDFKPPAYDESSEDEPGLMPMRNNLNNPGSSSPENSFVPDAGKSNIPKDPAAETESRHRLEALEYSAERLLRAKRGDSRRPEEKPADRSPKTQISRMISEDLRPGRVETAPVSLVKADDERAPTVRDAKRDASKSGDLSIRDAPKVAAPERIVTVHERSSSGKEPRPDVHQLSAMLSNAVHNRSFAPIAPDDTSFGPKVRQRSDLKKGSDAQDAGQSPARASPEKQLMIVGRPHILGDNMRGPRNSERAGVPRAQEQVVNVTIGRIEIRASQKAPVQKHSGFKQPVMSLDEYLRRRAEGGIG